MKRPIQYLAAAALLLTLSSSLAYPQAQLEPPAEMRSTVQNIIGGQINAFRARDHDQAFSYAAPSIQKMFGSTDRFISMVKKGYGAIYGARVFSFGRTKVQGDILVQEVLITGPQGRDWVAIYTLRQQADGTWRIAGVQMKQGEAQST